jgi:enoyl-CoA hydratase/carnithine racemase
MIWERAVNDSKTAVMYIDQVQNPVSVMQISGAFDEILDDGGIRTLVIASRHEKIWCNGLDIPWIMEQYKADNRAAVKEFFTMGNLSYLRRLISMPVVTIAAITGHAFGNGAIAALMCDILYMRSDRGYLCLPEAVMDLTDAFAPSAMKLFSIRYDPFIKKVMIPTAKRMTAPELEENLIIERACENREAVMAASLARAKEISSSDSLYLDLLEKRKRWSVPVIAAMEGEDPGAFDNSIELFWRLMKKMSG